MEKIIVTIIGVAGIVFIYWFFLKKSEKQVEVNDAVTITVDGGYSPEVISVQKGKKTTLNFYRKDPNSCLEEVVLPDFRVKKFLPVDKTVSISITPQKTGEFIYSCGMNMFHGKIIVT
jgi:plastocyanin domain-containing protein